MRTDSAPPQFTGRLDDRVQVLTPHGMLGRRDRIRGSATCAARGTRHRRGGDGHVVPRGRGGALAQLGQKPLQALGQLAS